MNLPKTISIEEAVKGENDLMAARNRARLKARGISSINIMSAPGSGKTELLTRTLSELSRRLRAAVIVGDIATDNDARRLVLSGAEAIQITTNGYCHLDAGMVARAIDSLDLSALDLVIIENVGNMVCPAAFDLGEDLRVAVISITEGEDKPLKYPTLFKCADVVVVNKIDLAEAVGLDRQALLDNLANVAPQASIFELSARTGQGVDRWIAYLQNSVSGAHALADRCKCGRKDQPWLQLSR